MSNSDSASSLPFQALEEAQLAQQQPHFGVKELTTQLAECVGHFFHDLRLKGEIGSLKHGRGGHFFMTMKEGDASLEVVIWSREVRALPYIPKIGDEVLVSGAVKLKPGSGVASFHVKNLIPTGEGLIQAQFEQTKADFEARGLFNNHRKLPMIPRGVGLISSQQSSAYADFFKSAGQRAPGIPIIFVDAVMQGSESVSSVSAALQALYQDPRVEVIALTRGGGAMEQLWYFNHPDLCYLIARSPKPVVVGIGHEDNTLIAELVADHRGHTPTNVAEQIFPKVSELRQYLSAYTDRLQHAIDRAGGMKVQRLNTLVNALLPVSPADGRSRQLDELCFQLDRRGTERLHVHRSHLQQLRDLLHHQAPHLKVERAHSQITFLIDALERFELGRPSHERLDGLFQRLQDALQKQLERSRHSFFGLVQSLEDLSPLKTLARGYSVVERENKVVIRDAHQVEVGDRINIQLKRGRLMAEILEREVSTLPDISASPPQVDPENVIETDINEGDL